MKKRWPFVLILILLVGAGITFHWWFPPLVSFAGTNADAIQGLSGLIQIVIWLGSVVLFWIGFLRKPKEAPKPLVQPQDAGYKARLKGNGAIAQGDGAVAVGKGGVHIGGNVSGSTIGTGDKDKDRKG
jgi:hypothetical protein